LPAVPDGFNSLLAISGGAAVLSNLIDRLKGGFGTGESKPRLGDLISRSNVLNVERAQFLVWTLCGSTMVSAHFAWSQQFPLRSLSVPPTFIWLTVISCGVYLGGKLVRKPGPIIQEISTRVDEDLNRLNFDVRGSSFSSYMRFNIDGMPVNSAHCRISPLNAQSNTELPLKPGQQILPIEGTTGNDTGFSLEIDAQEEWLQGHHTLRVINADNQSADASYIGLAFIYRPLKAASPVFSSNDKSSLVLTGVSVDPKTVLAWHDPNGLILPGIQFSQVSEPLPVADHRPPTTLPSVTTVHVFFTPGLKHGRGRLVFTPPSGKQFSVPVEVQ
jgi:hypothetical protein